MQVKEQQSQTIQALPSPDEVRAELARKSREVQWLRRLLRLSESVARASCTREEAVAAPG